jgi:hypothetical protein
MYGLLLWQQGKQNTILQYEHLPTLMQLKITLAVYINWISVTICPLPFINLIYRTYVSNHRLKVIYSNSI